MKLHSWWSRCIVLAQEVNIYYENLFDVNKINPKGMGDS